MKDQKRYMNLSGAEALLEFQEDQDEVDAALEAEQRALAREAGGEFTPMARPIFLPTDEERKLVRDLSTAGIPIPIIGQAIKWPESGRPFSAQAMIRHFPSELRDGHVQATTAVAGSLFKVAMAGNVAAIAFWLRTRGFGAYTEVQRTEVTGKDGKDLPTNSGVLMVPTPASAEDWERLVSAQQAELMRAAADPAAR